MKNVTKFAIAAAALVAGGIAAAPASAQPYGYYAPRGVVCDPYSRFYDPFTCTQPYYSPAWGFGGPSLSFNFGSGFHDFGRGNDRGRGGWNRGGNNGGGHSGGNPGNGNHGNSGGHRH